MVEEAAHDLLNVFYAVCVERWTFVEGDWLLCFGSVGDGIWRPWTMLLGFWCGVIVFH